MVAIASWCGFRLLRSLSWRRTVIARNSLGLLSPALIRLKNPCFLAKNSLTSRDDSRHRHPSNAPAGNLRTPEGILQRNVEETQNQMRRGFLAESTLCPSHLCEIQILTEGVHRFSHVEQVAAPDSTAQPSPQRSFSLYFFHLHSSLLGSGLIRKIGRLDCRHWHQLC